MDFQEAQKDMRHAYMGGGPGALVSSLIWLIAGGLAIYTSNQTSILVFFFGGMLIHPMGILGSKFFNRTGKHQPDNPLAKLAMESTLILFIGLFIAYLIFQLRADWFFSIMLMMIGLRYVIFQSIYGLKIYWVLGLTLTIAGIVCLVFNQAIYIAAILGGLIELIFSIVIIRSERKTNT